MPCFSVSREENCHLPPFTKQLQTVPASSAIPTTVDLTSKTTGVVSESLLLITTAEATQTEESQSHAAVMKNSTASNTYFTELGRITQTFSQISTEVSVHTVARSSAKATVKHVLTGTTQTDTSPYLRFNSTVKQLEPEATIKNYALWISVAVAIAIFLILAVLIIRQCWTKSLLNSWFHQEGGKRFGFPAYGSRQEVFNVLYDASAQVNNGYAEASNYEETDKNGHPDDKQTVVNPAYETHGENDVAYVYRETKVNSLYGANRKNRDL